ncbi:hypothetical protein MGN70_010774 [Eutypa lata]|nr:hypothetical protein MGN70_010774 [Eutypa lata]
MSLRDESRPPFRSRPPAPKPARSGELPQPWTAARCHRLLRPLISRIASLRKDAAISSSSSSSRPLDQSQVPDRTGAKRHSNECDWLLPSKRVKLHRTYSQKRHQVSALKQPGADEKSSSSKPTECSRQGGTTRPHGDIVAPTPLLRRVRGHALSSLSNDTTSSHGEPKQALQNIPQPIDFRIRRKPTLPQKQLDERLAALKSQMPSSRHSDYEAIYKSLEALLTATDAKSGEKQGPRSFLDMCLRKVPEYILELEAWEKSEAEENGTFSALGNVDTSLQIYNELESLGPVQGWRHLRVVVRADGLRALREAISEGLFDSAFLELLVDLCTVLGAPSEAEELIEAMIQREYACPQTPDASFAELPSMQPLLTLGSFANKTGRVIYLLRHNTSLLSNNSLPRDWLGTREFDHIWGLAVRNISKTEAASEATEFMIQSISLLSIQKRRPNGRIEQQPQLEKELTLANQQALVNALSTVAAMSSLGENEIRSSRLSEADAAKVSRISKRLQYILQSSLAETSASNRAQAGAGMRLLHLALFLSSIENQSQKARDTVKENIEAINRAYIEYATSTTIKEDRIKRQYNAMISLISSTARSYARGLSLPSHDCLNTLFRHLETLDLEDSILERMKAASAFTLAQQTHNVRDLIYAEKLTMSDSEGSNNEPLQTRSLFAGYRWDATIGEWVTVSPVKQSVNKQRQRRLLRSSSTASLRSSGGGGQGIVATTRSHLHPPARSVSCQDNKESLHAAAGDCPEEPSPTRGARRGDCVVKRRRHSSCLPQEEMRGIAVIATATTEKTATPRNPAGQPHPLRRASSNPKMGVNQNHLYDNNNDNDDELSQQGDKENCDKGWDRTTGRKRTSGSRLPGRRSLVSLSAASARHSARSSLSRRAPDSVHGDVSSDDELGM